MSCADSPRCKCGQEIRYPNHNLCEDCWAFDQERWPGKSQRVDTNSILDPVRRVDGRNKPNPR